MRGVVDGVRERHLPRAARRARAACAPASRGHDRQRLQAGGRLEAWRPARRRRRRSRRAARRRRCRGGPRWRVASASRSASQLEQVIGGQQAGDDRRRARARGRPSAGSPSGSRSGSASAGCSRSKARTREVRRGRGARPGPSRPRSARSRTTSSSSVRPSAAAKQSKPGPEVRRGGGDADAPAYGSPSTARSIARSSARTGSPRRRLLERDLGVLQAVPGEHARDPLGAVGAVLEQPRHRGRRRRLAEDPLASPPAAGRRRGSPRR